jgi:hypothetical protein
MHNWKQFLSITYGAMTLVIGTALSQPVLSSNLEKSVNEATLMQQQGQHHKPLF